MSSKLTQTYPNQTIQTIGLNNPTNDLDDDPTELSKIRDYWATLQSQLEKVYKKLKQREKLLTKRLNSQNVNDEQ